VLVEAVVFLVVVVVVVEQVQVAPERDGVVARVHEEPVALHADDGLVLVAVAAVALGGGVVAGLVLAGAALLVGGWRGDGSAAASHG
jgi:hypothetical protein